MREGIEERDWRDWRGEKEEREETASRRINHPKLRLQLQLCLRAPDLRRRGREKLLRLRKRRLAFQESKTLSLHLGFPPLPLRRRKQTNRPAMTNIQNPNCPPGRSPIFLHVHTDERTESGNVRGRRIWTGTETGTGIESGLLTHSKHVVEASITPGDGATGVLTVAETGGVVVEAGQSTITESPDHAQIYLWLEALLPSATGKKAKHAARAQTLKFVQSVDGAGVQTQILRVKVVESLPVIPDPLIVSLAPNLAVH